MSSYRWERYFFLARDDLSLFPLTRDGTGPSSAPPPRPVPNPTLHMRVWCVTMIYFFSGLFSRLYHVKTRFHKLPFWGLLERVYLRNTFWVRVIEVDRNKIFPYVCEFKNNPIRSLISRVGEWVNLQNEGAYHWGMLYRVVLLHLEFAVGLEVVQDPPGTVTKINK